MLEWVTGAVVVSSLLVALVVPITWGILDVVRQYRTGEMPKPPTASNWIGRFAVRHPWAIALLFQGVGVLLGHLLWPQVIHFACP
jgi:hypothetical protein